MVCAQSAHYDAVSKNQYPEGKLRCHLCKHGTSCLENWNAHLCTPKHEHKVHKRIRRLARTLFATRWKQMHPTAKDFVTTYLENSRDEWILQKRSAELRRLLTEAIRPISLTRWKQIHPNAKDLVTTWLQDSRDDKIRQKRSAELRRWVTATTRLRRLLKWGYSNDGWAIPTTDEPQTLTLEELLTQPTVTSEPEEELQSTVTSEPEEPHPTVRYAYEEYLISCGCPYVPRTRDL